MAEVIGRRREALRLDAKVTLEQMARVAQRYGLPWTSGRVGDFEAGRTAPSLPTLVAVTAALGEAIGRPVSLAELVTGEGQVHINNNLSLDTVSTAGRAIWRKRQRACQTDAAGDAPDEGARATYRTLNG